MADIQNVKIQERDYRLCKEIQVKFREVVDPLPLSDYLVKNCLTEDDVDIIQTKLVNGGRSKAAGELLDKLRRRHNWVFNLLEACRHQELGLDHLYTYIKDKITKLEIQVTMRRKDGHNCGGFSDLVSDVSEETVTHHGQRTKLVIEQILAEFKTRVDPEDFLQYLTGLNEEDEEAVKCKQQQRGRLAAAEELVSRLRNYKNWKVDLQEALIRPGSGLKDLGKKLSIDESNKPKKISNMDNKHVNQNNQGKVFTALCAACLNGKLDVVKLLIKSGANVNAINKDGYSPLFVACENGYDNIVQFLLSAGADVNLCLKNKSSPLFKACFDGKERIVQLLLDRNVNVNKCDENGASPLFVACYNGHHKIVELLLKNGADTNLCHENMFSPLYAACYHGHEKIVALLLQYVAKINLCLKDGTSPFYIANCNGHENTVKLLLEKGVNVDQCDENNISPLIVACQNEHVNIVELLLQKGANVNLCAKDGKSPLIVASENGSVETVRILLQNGADINLSTEN